MRSLANDRSAIKHNNAISLYDRRQSMRDDDDGPFAMLSCNRATDSLLTSSVQGARSLVQY